MKITRIAYKKWIAAVLVFFIGCMFTANASASSTTSEKIDDLEQEKEQTEQKINKESEKISDMEESKGNLEGYLGDLKSQLGTIEDELYTLNQQMEQKEQEIAETQQRLEEAKATEEKQYQDMKKRIKFMYEKNDTDYVEMVLTSKTMTEFLTRAEYIKNIAEYDRRMLAQYKQTKEQITQDEAKLQEEKTTLASLQNQTKQKQDKVAVLVSGTKDNISQYESDIAEAEKKALEYEKKLREQEEQLDTLKKKLEEEKAAEERARKAAENGTSSYNITSTPDLAKSASDLQLLAAIIECEAGGEPWDGKIAVGNVVMNRVRSNAFPNTILEVLYQNGQFTPVKSGRFIIVLSRGANATCVSAAQKVLDGEVVMATQLYFRTVNNIVQGTVIGNHVFY